MEKQEIKKISNSLKILKYDSSKHNSITMAVKEILSEEKYDLVMRGIIANKNHLQEVQDILKAYNIVKPYEDDIINGKFNNFTENEEIQTIDEFVVLETGEERIILKKELENDQYITIFNGNKIKGCPAFYVDKNKVYNFHGKCISENYDKWYNKISDNLFEMHDYIISLDGSLKNIVFDNSIELDGNISDEEKMLFFQNVQNSKLEYLNEEHLFDYDGFICTQKNECVNYYTLDGQKIISSDDDGYFYIEKKFKVNEDGRHIIVVGKIDNYMNKKYGYYDLDNRCEFVEPQFVIANSWHGYGACALTSDCVCFINESGKIFKYSVCDPKSVFPLRLKGDKEWRRFENYKDAFRILSNFDHWGSDHFLFNGLKKIKDNLYIAEFISPVEYTHPTRYDYAYSLVKDALTNPVIVSDFYLKIILQSIDNELFFAAKSKGTYDKSWFLLNADGQEREIFSKESYTMDTPIYLSSFFNLSIKNSFFLEDKYKTAINMLEDKKQTYELDVLKLEIEKLRKDYLEQVKKIKFSSNNIPDDYIVSCVKKPNDKGTVILGLDSLRNKIIYDKSQNYFVYGNDVKEIHLNEYDHVLVELDYNDVVRKILVDKNGEMIIGLSVDIVLTQFGYIVTRCDLKQQLFDYNGLPLTEVCDNINLVSKFYIDNSGLVKKKEEKLCVTNCGNTYLLDENKDYILYSTDECREIINQMKVLKI